MKQSNIPKLRAAQVFPSWKRDFTGHLAQHCLVDVINSAFVIPALRVGNTPAAVAANIDREKALQKDERVYGFIVSALNEFPTLRSKLMDDPTLSLSEPNILPSGSNMYKALIKELTENPNEAFYSAIETKIGTFTQKAKPMPMYIAELDNLFAQLPERLQYSDGKKLFTLRKGLHKDYESFAISLSATTGITYAKMCSSLISEFHHQEAVTQEQAVSLTEGNKHVIARIEEQKAESEFSQTESANFATNFQKHRRLEQDNHDNHNSAHRFDITCYNCNNSGHIARHCRAPKYNTGDHNFTAPIDDINDDDQSSHVPNQTRFTNRGRGYRGGRGFSRGRNGRGGGRY